MGRVMILGLRRITVRLLQGLSFAAASKTANMLGSHGIISHEGRGAVKSTRKSERRQKILQDGKLEQQSHDTDIRQMRTSYIRRIADDMRSGSIEDLDMSFISMLLIGHEL
jgi:hypothetical protein